VAVAVAWPVTLGLSDEPSATVTSGGQLTLSATKGAGVVVLGARVVVVVACVVVVVAPGVVVVAGEVGTVGKMG